MSSVVEFSRLFDLEKIETNQFVGHSCNAMWGRVFGGQVVAQALVAAQRTVACDRFAHSLHAYFLRAGDPHLPIIYEVEIIRDGGSFSARQVRAKQEGELIFLLCCSFQKPEGGFESHREKLKNIPQPEELKEEFYAENASSSKFSELVKSYLQFHKPFAVRPVDVDNYLHRHKRVTTQQLWFKLSEPVIGREDQKLRAAILSYFSDMSLLDTALYVHGFSIFSKNLQFASIDHSMWFHRDFSLDDWLLYELESPNSSGARGLSRGFIYNREGVLLASVAQEGLMRLIGRPQEQGGT